MTTAFLVLRLCLGQEFRFRPMPFDQIMDEVVEGRADAGLLIHEGQLTYEQHGLQQDRRPRRVVAARDRAAATPRGQRRPARPRRASGCTRSPRSSARRSRPGSITGEDALEYALAYGRGLDEGLADRFVGMYVNELTQDYGVEGRQAVEELLRRGEQIGAFPDPVRVEFVS